MTNDEFKHVFDGTSREDARNKVDLAVNDLEALVDKADVSLDEADDLYADIYFLGQVATRLLDMEAQNGN